MNNYFEVHNRNISQKRFNVNSQSDIVLYHNSDMDSFGERVKKRRLKMGMTQGQLSELAGLSQTTISDIERGRNKRSGDVTALSRALKVNAVWLAEGKGLEEQIVSSGNIQPAPDMKGDVPLISWVQAGAWTDVIDNFQPGDAEEWFPCPARHSENTFALLVRGESMYNPHGRPSFFEGDVIFVDPQRQPVNGSLVVVRLDDGKEATFKKLIIEGDQKYLKALNPAWPEKMIEIDGNATICGVVFYKGERF